MRARKRFGQHFLEPAWIGRLLDVLAPEPGDAFIEIGPGTGALTLPLAARVARVIAVEVDRNLAGHLSRVAPANVEVVTADFLQTDVAALLARSGPGRPVRIVGNLPYNVSTPILFRILEAAGGGRAARDATLMLQREVVDRLVAAPGGAEYGVLSILVQLHAEVTRLLDVPPGAFRPVPKVRSAVLRLTFRPPPMSPQDAECLARLVRSVFTRRRKVLANALKPFAETAGVSPAAALAAAGVNGRRRPETLQLAELARLVEVFTSATRSPVL